MTIDEEPTYIADAIEIELHGQFDRTQGGNADDVTGVAFPLLRTVFSRLRCLGRAFFMKFDTQDVSWRIQYLTDAGEEFEPQDGLVRGRGTASVSVSPFMWIAPEQWASLEGIATTPSAPASDELWLDSLDALPHVGATVVLAYTAIEVRIASALNILASNSPAVGAGMWSWINDREQFLKEPSVEEQLTDLMQLLAGKSLKQERQLWEGYCNLRKARNSFAHEGIARLLDKTIVTATKAHELVHSAAAIIGWIESSLPEPLRTPSVATPNRMMRRQIPLLRT